VKALYNWLKNFFWLGFSAQISSRRLWANPGRRRVDEGNVSKEMSDIREM
jgi:hypothetical protein